MSCLRNSLWWVLAVALVVRVAALWVGRADLRDDPDAYMRLATNWSRSGVFGFESPDGAVQPTAYRPPLYPWLLSWLVVESPAASAATPAMEKRSGALERGRLSENVRQTYWLPTASVATLHLLLGLGGVWLTWSIARDLQITRPAFAALLVACDPILLRASQLVMTETLAASLALLAWKLWLVVYPRRPQYGPSGLAAGSIPGNSQMQNPRLAPSAQSQNPRLAPSAQLLEGCGGGPRAGEAVARRSLGQWLALLSLGGVFGVSILARPTAAPWAALGVFGMCWLGCQGWQQRLKDGLIVSLMVVACLTPWVLRNLELFGKPIWATTHGGYTLLLANNPLIYQHFAQHGPSRNWDAEPFHARWALRLAPDSSRTPSEEAFWFAPREASVQPPVNLPELADDRLAYTAARATIARQPLMFCWSSLIRIGWLWSAWPNTGPVAARVAIGLWYACLFVAAILGSCRIVRQLGLWGWLRQWWLPLMLLLSLTLIHAIFWSNMRMRAPACGVLAIAAAAGGRQAGRRSQADQQSGDKRVESLG